MTRSDRPDDDRPAPEEDGVIQAEFDWSSRSPCTAVIETVAIASDSEPTTIEPLYESADPDALNALIRSNGSGSKDGDVAISFVFADHDVTVHSDGVIVVRPVA